MRWVHHLHLPTLIFQTGDTPQAGGFKYKKPRDQDKDPEGRESITIPNLGTTGAETGDGNIGSNLHPCHRKHGDWWEVWPHPAPVTASIFTKV